MSPRRRSGEILARALCDTETRRKTAPARRNEMNINTKTAKLNWMVTAFALALATVAAQSPFF
jgi:hypothetical protein